MLKKMSPTVHNRPEFKEVRKAFQGINSTPKIAREKSIKRHEAHAKVLEKVKDYVKLPKQISPKEKLVSRKRLNEAYKIRANTNYNKMSPHEKHKADEESERQGREDRRHPDDRGY